MTIAPWLDIRPSNFLQAAQAGTQAGNEIARTQLANRAQIANSAEAQAVLAQQARDAQARQMLAQQELLQRARQAQMQNQIEQQANQSRQLLGLIGEQRMEDDTQKNERYHDQQIGLEGQRVKLEEDRNNRLRYIKSGNGAYSFDPVTGEAQPIIDNTTPTAAAGAGAANLLKYRNSLLDQAKLLDPSDKEAFQSSSAEIRTRIGNIDGKLQKLMSAQPAVSLTAPPTLQPTITATSPSGPQVGDTINGGVFAGGGVLPVAPGVPTNSTATLQPTVEKRIRVKDKYGKVGTIPESQLSDALGLGYTKLP